MRRSFNQIMSRLSQKQQSKVTAVVEREVMTALHNEIAVFLEEERQRAARELIDRAVKDL